jgi:hypothetical protein
LPKTCVGSTKTVIQHDLQQLYISELLQRIFSTASHRNGEVQVLGKLPYLTENTGQEL